MTCISAFDKLRSKQLEERVIIEKPPVFIIGHWRSGTTFLHNLLSCMSDAAYPTTFHTVFPNNLFAFKGIIKWLMQYFLPKRRPVDEVKMDSNNPQEEEMAFGNAFFFSYYYWFYFPKEYDEIAERFLFVEHITDEEQEKFKKNYVRFIKRTMINTGGSRYISKNPPNTARIPILLDMFPEAKFIYLSRDPYETLVSTYRFCNAFLKTLQLQEFNDTDLWKIVIDTYRSLIERYRRYKSLIPEDQLIEIQYKDLVNQPEHVLDTIFDRFFPGLPEEKERIIQHIPSLSEHKANTYRFEKDFIRWVNREIGPLIVEQGYSLRKY
ncbi:MAG: sulfotransferase [Bacteroidales bacterium]|nr:MAG: sulfotransferase [Bacteroidales bacterium]